MNAQVLQKAHGACISIRGEPVAEMEVMKSPHDLQNQGCSL